MTLHGGSVPEDRDKDWKKQLKDKRVKLVITGGSGLLAINWAINMRNRADICLFTHNHNVNINNVDSKKVNLDDIDEITQAISNTGADIVIHTAGMTSVDLCEQNPDKAYYANVTLANNVAIAVSNLNKKLIHISTDHLFDGNKPLVSEDEPPNPVNVYGKTKAEAEKLIMTVNSSALIVRTNFYGWGHSGRVSLSDWVINSLQNHQIVTAFHDAFFTPILIDHLANIVHELIDHNINGIINVCGSKRISKYDFAKAITKFFNFDEKLIQKTSIDNANLHAVRPKDMSLNNKKAIDLLDRSFGDLDSGLLELYQQGKRKKEFVKAVCIN